MIEIAEIEIESWWESVMRRKNADGNCNKYPVVYMY